LKEKDYDAEKEDEEKERKNKRQIWESDAKNITKRVDEAIEKGLARQKEKEELKRKREEQVQIKFFGMGDDISESDSEEIEQTSKKHCPSSRNFNTPIPNSAVTDITST